MNFFKKLFGNTESKEPNKNKSGNSLSDSRKIEELLSQNIQNATKIIVQKASRMPDDANLKSHFGGKPYFEAGEVWPKSKSGKNLNFIFQIFNTGEIELPQNIQLVQFFYDYEEMPWSSDEDGWLVKIYEKLDTDKVISINKPEDLDEFKYCEVVLENVKSLPDWEGLNLHNLEISDFICQINDDEPWETYDEMVKKLTGQEDYQSQLGGYPKWVQGESTPQNKEGENLKLLFQIDTEENADLMWGDVGSIYVFYDEKYKKFEFELQCC